MQDRPAALRSSCLPAILSSTRVPVAAVAPNKNWFSDPVIYYQAAWVWDQWDV